MQAVGAGLRVRVGPRVRRAPAIDQRPRAERATAKTCSVRAVSTQDRVGGEPRTVDVEVHILPDGLTRLSGFRAKLDADSRCAVVAAEGSGQRA